MQKDKPTNHKFEDVGFGRSSSFSEGYFKYVFLCIFLSSTTILSCFVNNQSNQTDAQWFTVTFSCNLQGGGNHTYQTARTWFQAGHLSNRNFQPKKVQIFGLCLHESSALSGFSRGNCFGHETIDLLEFSFAVVKGDCHQRHQRDNSVTTGGLTMF